MFWLAANTGMLRSELLGLHWSDVDLATAHLPVNRALVSVSYELHESRGKTRNSSRWIDLDPTTVDVLDRWRERVEGELGRSLSDDDYVFCSPTGAPTHSDRYSQIFNKIASSRPTPPISPRSSSSSHRTSRATGGSTYESR